MQQSARPNCGIKFPAGERTENEEIMGERRWPLLNIGLTFLAETLEALGKLVHRLANPSAGGREAPSCPGDPLQGLVHTLHRKPAQVEGSAKSCQNLAGAFGRS